MDDQPPTHEPADERPPGAPSPSRPIPGQSLDGESLDGQSLDGEPIRGTAPRGHDAVPPPSVWAAPPSEWAAPPSEAPATRGGSRARKLAVGVAAAAGVAVGATALAGATTSPSSSPADATAAASTTTTTAPGGSSSVPGGPGAHARGPHGGFGAFGMGVAGGVVHGEFTVPGPNGGYETLAERTGTVSDVTNTSGSTWTLTVKSADGTSGTFTVDSSTSVNGGEMGVGSVKTGDTVHVIAVVNGSTSTAKQVVDQTLATANGGTWRPIRPYGGPKGAGANGAGANGAGAKGAGANGGNSGTTSAEGLLDTPPV